MATVRVSSLRAGPPPSARRARVSALTATITAASTRVARVARLSATVTPAASQKVRVSSLRATGTRPFAIAFLPARTVEPYDVVNITPAVAAGSPVAASWTWRRISGPDLILNATGATVSFLAPAGLTEQTLVLGVTAKSTTGDVSAERTVSIKIYSHTIYTLSGSTWKPSPLGPVPSRRFDAVPIGPSSRGGIVRKQVYSEDFTRQAAVGAFRSVYSEMGYYDGFNDTSGYGRYTPDRVLSAHDGLLDAYLHVENGQPLSAAIMPDNYQPTLGGRWDMRFKTTTPGDGFKFVGMLWPSSDNWNDGEIDWPEADIGDYPRPASAIPGSYSGGKMSFLPVVEVSAPTDTTDFHIASTEWNYDPTNPDNNWLRFYWDDNLVTEIRGASNLPSKPMRLTLQFETWIGQGPVPDTAAGAHILVDWISKWV